jgi:tetratricopeptide (TPR) repeat protein
MKKTVFKGTVNGIHFDDVRKYNEYLTKLIEAGETFSAETSTQTIDCDEVIRSSGSEEESKEYNAKDLLPYFSYDNDEYYLDKLITGDASTDKELLDKAIATLQDAFAYIKTYLNDSNVSTLNKRGYVDKVLDIINTMKKDARSNAEALEKLGRTRAVATKDYEKAIAEAETEYKSTIAACDMEERVLNNANVLIDNFYKFYTDVLTLASKHIDEPKCECGGNCKECCCDSKCEQNIKTEVKEKSKPQVKDLNTLFNKIFGIDLDDLSKHLNA